MTQTATILTRTGSIQVELPAPDTQVMPEIAWGSVEAFPTPAYWRYQVLSRRLAGSPAPYKLGRTLAEEVGACLLGGHGIPGKVGVAAFEHLREKGAFSQASGPEQLQEWLKQPLEVDGRKIHYRFAAQKARYLAAVIPDVLAAPVFQTGRTLRDWLTTLPGIGPKTASWVARNWLDADDVAILDIHIMRVGQALGLFPREWTVERHYLQLEALFLEFGRAIDVRPAELDAVMWYEMASSPATARFVMDQLGDGARGRGRRKGDAAQPVQLRLAA